ncbi:MAG: TolC family outer membrane protein [Hyphomonadaceae bacterium]|nr:TolC family outer membrane protein [Hyphomonadaceae bacterium]MBX3511693.1 TolC family outer membrane protein [Hyphomonadaceae bacterium]
MRTTLLVSLIVLAAAMPAAADTLPQAMADAVQSNPTLAAQRQRLAATREALPQAWAAALPQVSASASATSADRELATTTGAGRSETYSAGLSASQLLFGSGSVLASTRGARAQIRGAVANYDLATQSLLLDVTSAYANVRQANAVVAARQITVDNLSTLFDYAQAQFDAGVVTRTDVAQSQARLAQARTQLVQAQGLLAASVQTYARLVGRPPSDLQPPPTTPGLPTDLETALQTAGTQSPLLRSAIAATEAADANVALAASAGGPRVTLEAGSSLAGDFNVDDAERNGDSVGVRFSMPLFQGGAIQSRTRQQRALRAASNLDLAAAQRQVQENVTTAWTNLASARAAVQSAREQVDAAELAYEGVRLEQETGLRSTVEVLDQEQDLLTARLAAAQAERDLVVAERQMLAAIGTLTAEPEQTGARPDDSLRGR